ncbi:hypothetical protein CFIO01_04293 [Colletotrichum fioriniae PJ7]|uniref:C2H2-type domain-containing protein n=1 Tax=Colletotrichum fioriniae PJ7 TaxID=1445577 RepID=A0A010RJJ9_9PEZI|nr:hypothetical protein CFIO01_04293 [Colletotrichum fioriniae PJ7]
MEDSIASLVSRVIARFSHLLDATQNPIVYRPLLNVHPKLEDEQARFKVWAGNVGAHKTSRSSLEYRLRDASELRLFVGKLLSSLIKCIDGAIKTLSDLGSAHEGSGQNHEDLISDLEAYMERFPDIINCLMRLIITIQNPAPWDRFLVSTNIDTSVFEIYDTQHVSAKFEGIDSQLAQRLGRAISRRRQYFKYREVRHEKLSRQADEEVDANVADTMSSTVASSIYDHSKPLSQIYDFSESQDTASVTSYDASSLGDSQEMSVPELPQEAHDGPFECQFCFMIVDIRDTRVWRIWRCPFDCNRTFKSASQSAEHLQTKHRSRVRDEHIDFLVKQNSRPLDENAEVTCELCSETLSSLKNYRHHAGKHQQQLALFALPHVDEPEPDQGQAIQQRDSDSDTEAEADSDDEAKAESKDKTISKDKTASKDNADSKEKTDSKDKGRGPGNSPGTIFEVHIQNPFTSKSRPT